MPALPVRKKPFSDEVKLSLRLSMRAMVIGRLKPRVGGSSPVTHNMTLRRRNALPMTDTELKLMAALAIIGLSSKPNTG
jgi:hypothetical protein